jgi:hypothetical protein
MLDEKKGTCCHKCGHVHVKGTSCPTPYLKGERSCARRSLKEAEQTNHYKERKVERGTIAGIEMAKAAYGEYNVEETNQKLIPFLQTKLNQKLAEVEGRDFEVSNNFNLGVCVLMPILVSGDKKYKITMVTNGDEKGTFYLAILMNNALITMYPTNASGTKEVESTITDHTKREYPDNNKDAKALFPESSIVEINIDELYGKEVKKAGEQKASEDTLDYKVRTDYRVGTTFDHKQFGPGKIVAADKGGKAGPDGRIDWVDVKYAKPFMKGGKLQDTRRFNNILTSAYFGKTVKELHTMKHNNHDEHHQLRADVDEASKGLWANIRAKQARGEKPAKKGSEAYNKAVSAAKKINALDETEEYCPTCLAEYLTEYADKIEEAEYRGRKVSLGKPFLTPGGPKKRSVYVKNAKGNVVKVNFGDPNLKIKKNIPARRKSFRARHKCDTAKDRTSPRYWSCKAW